MTRVRYSQRKLLGVLGLSHLLAVLLAVGASGCALDSRKAGTLDLSGDAGPRVVSENSGQPGNATAPGSPEPNASGGAAVDTVDRDMAAAANCETPGCEAQVPLLQPPAPSECPEGEQCLLILGEACTDAGDCASASCHSTEAGPSVCCAATCSETELCSADGSSCVAPQSTLGQRCFEDSECESNSCADGVCCNEACDGVCETCADTGICQAPFDDNACPIVRCGSLDESCAEVTADLVTDRCQSKGLCKALDACGLSPEGRECEVGFCSSAGQCQAPTVNCGGACETTGLIPGLMCCSIADTFELECLDERDCNTTATSNRGVLCDEHSDCRTGSVCCSVSTPSSAFVRCMPEAECAPQPGVRASFSQICSAPGASTSPCPVGQQCVASDPNGYLPDWSFCVQL